MPATAPVSLLPCDLRREGERLFDVSMWCLGRDVLCPDGNLLLRRGLTRHARPSGVEGQSVYGSASPGGGRLTLWGFGVLCESRGEALLVPRDGFLPRRLAKVPAAPCFRAQDLGVLREPASGRERRIARWCLAEVAEWLADHETWVTDVAGAAWRRGCLASRRRAAPCPAEALAPAWRRLAAHIRSLDTPTQSCEAPVRDGRKAPCSRDC